MKIIGQVFEETNYDAFAKLPDNRDLSPGRLNKLIASISERYILNPIIVNEKMEIIDGQGRLNALRHWECLSITLSLLGQLMRIADE